jgi:two-component system chemotaxis response regulator CheY
MTHNVLIVDDSASVRNIILKSLGMSGYALGKVFQAGDGREALGTLVRESIDLVFTDLNMPEMDGEELVRRIRAYASLRELPVIVVSTEGSEERIDGLRKLGRVHFLRKPFRPEHIRVAVEISLGGPHA